jgi:hypothetical protein
VLRFSGILTAAVAAVALLAPTAAAADTTWEPIGSDRARPLDESQGLASVERNGTTSFRYTGVGTVDPGLAAQGWNHIGDPGAGGGYYVEPYQRDDRGAKLYRVEAPDGARTDFRHELEFGEAPNNSFAAVSPDTQWLVTGEYGTMSRLLVLPMPGAVFTDPDANLPLASTIQLDHPVLDVQGCDFVTGTRLLCSSDDPEGSLFGTTKPLLRIDLSAPVSDTDVTGVVTSLGQLPLESACAGEFEAEGIDYDERDGTLRVVVLSPGFCVAVDSKTWRLRRE